MMAPRVTVAMLVFNGEKYLAEAMESILDQTFDDFEFLIINDGSTDRSVEIIRSYTDDRIVLVTNNGNRGIPYCRNLAIKLARGEFLAWFDCDDLSCASRLKRQVTFMEGHPDIAVCGTWLTRFGGQKSFVAKTGTDKDIIKAKLLFKTSMLNATTIWRLSFIRSANLSFNESLPISEDYDFYYRCGMVYPMANIPESLYMYRASETSIIRKYSMLENEYDRIHKIIYEKALTNLGCSPTGEQYRLHALIASEKMFESYDDYVSCFHWLKHLKSQNKKSKVYDSRAINRILGDEFFFISKKASHFGLRVFWFYMSRCCFNMKYVNPLKILKLAGRCVLKYDRFEFA